MKKDITKLEKELKKYKKINIILISILSLIILIVLIIISSFYLKNIRFLNKIKNEIVETKINIKNKIIDKEDLEYNENYHNARNELKLENPYNDNQATHPKVLYFKNGWNGYKYYMVYTPYAFGDDYRENPTINVSNDMINWTFREGTNNPLVNTPKDYISGKIYNSDPHLVYNYSKDTLECYYRYVNDKKDEVIIYRLTTKDGINWSKKEEIIKEKRSKKDYLSPAIIYDDGKYKMWYVFNKKIYYEESKDGYKYTNRKELKIKYRNKTLIPWHLDVIKTDLGYEMILVAYNDNDNRRTMNLYYTYSKNNIDYALAETILKPSQISWDNRGLYRSTFIKDGDIYYVFYSGISKQGLRGIGLSYGNIYNLIGSKIE